MRRVAQRCGLRRRSDSKATPAQLLRAMAMQALRGTESLGHHLRLMTGIHLSDSAAIAHKLSLPWEFMRQLLRRVLRPLATVEEQPDSFYHGLRLLAVDGTQWRLRNTESVLAGQRRRHTNRRGEQAPAAYLAMHSAVLLEVGTHQPLALECDQSTPQGAQEGELTLARRTLTALPAGPCLLLADRLYGNASFLADVEDAAPGRAQALVRVPQKWKSQIIQVLADGSALVSITSSGRGAPGTKKRQGQRSLVVREIRAQVQRGADTQDKDKNTEKKAGKDNDKGKDKGNVITLRLWTTLKDEKKHPAGELIKLYTQRWEQELFYRELKQHVSGGSASSLLKAQSEDSARLEVGSMILAASLAAQQRISVAQAVGLPPVRYSLLKIGRLLQSLCLTLHAGRGLLTPQQEEALIRRMLKVMEKEASIAPRKPRSCTRGVRRAVSHWPVIRTRPKLDPTLVVTPIPFSEPSPH